MPDPYQLNYEVVGEKTDEYCNICNPFQYDTSIMANPKLRAAHIQDTSKLYEDIATGNLPAVSFVKPSGLVDGHPASSKLDLFEGFSKKIVGAVRDNPKLWKDTAIFITFDKGGGYYDSGYVQPLDYLRRRHAHPAHGSVTLHAARLDFARVCRSRVDPEVHRAQLGPESR